MCYDDSRSLRKQVQKRNLPTRPFVVERRGGRRLGCALARRVARAIGPDSAVNAVRAVGAERELITRPAVIAAVVG